MNSDLPNQLSLTSYMEAPFKQNGHVSFQNQPKPHPGPRSRSVLQPLVLHALRAFLHDTTGLSTEPDTALTVDKLCTVLAIPESVALSVLQALRPFHLADAPGSPLLMPSLLACLLMPSPYPQGTPFVSHVLRHVLAEHPTLSHSYLRHVAEGSFPDPQLALLDLARQYQAYSGSFQVNMRAVLGKLRTPAHARWLRENLAEECGELSDGDRNELKIHGIEIEWVDGVPHPELFRRFLRAIEQRVPPSHAARLDGTAAGDSFKQTMSSFLQDPVLSEAAAVGALSIGTEAVVKPIYNHIIAGIAHAFPDLPPRDAVFFPLHTVVDDEHADTLMRIASGAVQRVASVSRAELVRGALFALDARHTLWDALEIRALAMPPCTPTVGAVEKATLSTSTLYDNQASNWVRHKPSCLSDFTGRPGVIDMLAPLRGKNVLDVGCGEGYISRIMRRDHHAATVLGLDVSGSMIAAAAQEERDNPLGNLHFAIGDATQLLPVVQTLGPTEVPAKIHPGDSLGSFDSAVACFLFNYISVSDMADVMRQVYELLRPGGQFVFAVPHPCFPFWDTSKVKGEIPFKWRDIQGGYFNSVDHIAEGTIQTRDRQHLNVRSSHKTFQVYFDSLKEAGFDGMPEVREVSVTDELLKLDREFFEPMDGIPLHAAFSVHKSARVPQVKLSPEILWPTRDGINVEKVTLQFPNKSAQELYTVSCELVDAGFSPDTTCADDIDVSRLQDAQQVALKLSNMLSGRGGYGAVLVRELFPEYLARTQTDDVMRMMYFVLSNLIGEVNRERGALWDVIDHGLSTADDNVLFSATCETVGFHTDGSRREFFPDLVGLFCQQGTPGHGNLIVANGCNLFWSLRASLPQHIFEELLSDGIIHDRITDGMGKTANISKCSSAAEVVSNLRSVATRSEAVLPLLLEDNTAPIFQRDATTGCMRMRYIRSWVDSGYTKANVQIPANLVIAMDALDEELKKGMQIQHELKRGEIMFTNNHCMPHAREAFPRGSGRHMVRVWINSDFGM